jgi:hypothetical protein
MAMEAVCSSEMLVDFYWTTWPHVSEGSVLDGHHYENLKFNTDF